MNTLVTRKPTFQGVDALQIAAEHFGIDVLSADELPSERDQNFRVVDRSGRAYVLKISNPDERPDVIDLQNQALLHLGRSPVGKYVPSIHPAVSGEASIDLESASGTHTVRLVTFLEGVPWGQARSVTERLVAEAGELLGRIDAELASFTHPAMGRYLYWDSRHALQTIEGNLPYLEGDRRRALIDRFVGAYRNDFLPDSGLLNQSVIHNDANDYNLLVDRPVEPSRLTGLIDFGDMVKTFTLCELANACAYQMMDCADPLERSVAMARGYCRGFDLTAAELRLSGYLIAIRLCLSVSNAARQKAQAPDNEYLTISENPAWQVLEYLADLDLSVFGEAMAEAGQSRKQSEKIMEEPDEPV